MTLLSRWQAGNSNVCLLGACLELFWKGDCGVASLCCAIVRALAEIRGRRFTVRRCASSWAVLDRRQIIWQLILVRASAGVSQCVDCELRRRSLWFVQAS